MANLDAKKSKKRRASVRDEEEVKPAAQESAFSQSVGLEMQSEDEGEDAGEDSDGEQVDEFPEIDTRSDSEDEDEDADADSEEDDEEEEDEDEDEPDESEDEFSDDSIHPFPTPKTVVSDITGQPKRVYPAIEPDYDSDSSTEETPNRVGNIPMHWSCALPAEMSSTNS
ncbi:hypothetical protein PsYK624_006940 [Phanerochaete sordida]|uniref:Uncharacterized protein n=1 Tax=Phanerochaete sordida TaxID=48140 RepID=A0A9P3FWZ0_9APHY|nr:hypothetical protein PsYK624_006940 [Phanerochaete sordida]